MQTPVVADRLVIDTYDHNDLAFHSHIGSLILSVKQLLAEGRQPGGFYTWCSLYGSPAENKGAEADAMNENPDIASKWKGMVLLHIQAEANDKPKKGVETMDPEIQKNAEELGFLGENGSTDNDSTYELIAEVGQGIALPEPDVYYKVQFAVKNYNWTTEVQQEYSGRYARWSSRSEVLSWKLPSNPHSCFNRSEGQLEGRYRQEFRLFIYLLDSSDIPVCFWSCDLSDFRNLNAKWRWIQLKPDLSYGYVENARDAGLISVKLSVTKRVTDGATDKFAQQPAWKTPVPKSLEPYNLRCFIFQCRDLPAADSDGSSDPFITIFNSVGEEQKTAVIEDNVNPIFMDCKEIGINLADVKDFSDAPPCIMDVMDADHGYISSSADFLGRCTIYMDQVKYFSNGEDDIPLPQWYDIKFGTDDDSPACGQILCSFALSKAFPNDLQAKPAEMNKMVEKIDFDVFINCLGLRELESIGLLPI